MISSTVRSIISRLWPALSLVFVLNLNLAAISNVNPGGPVLDSAASEFHFGDVRFLSKWIGRSALVVTDILQDSSYWYPKSKIIRPKFGCPVEIRWVLLLPARSGDRLPSRSYEVRVSIVFPEPGDSLLVTALASVGHVLAVAEVDSVMSRAFQFLAADEAESLEMSCYDHPANISILFNLPTKSESDASLRRMLRRSDLDPDDLMRVEGVDLNLLSEALLGDNRVRTLVIYRHSRIFLREFSSMPEMPGIDLVCLSIEYLDKSYPDTLRSYENVDLSLAIDGNTKRVYILNAKYRPEPRNNLFPTIDIEQFLYLVVQAGYSSKQLSEILEARLLRCLIYPHRGLVISTRFDTCMYRRSLEDESFFDLVESDSVVGVEFGAGLLSPSITPNLYEVWRQLYGYGCGQDQANDLNPELTKSAWKIWYRDKDRRYNVEIEQFELLGLEQGHPKLVRTVIPALGR